MTRFTPEFIEELADGEVFVFGSNELGLHGGGAAAVAVEKFGAVWGEGEGLFGRSYAIPTMGTTDELRAAVGRFLGHAIAHPDTTYLVTKIGTGIAGRPLAEVAVMFRGHPDNVIIPIEFEHTLIGS